MRNQILAMVGFYVAMYKYYISNNNSKEKFISFWHLLFAYSFYIFYKMNFKRKRTTAESDDDENYNGEKNKNLVYHRSVISQRFRCLVTKFYIVQIWMIRTQKFSIIVWILFNLQWIDMETLQVNPRIKRLKTKLNFITIQLA